MAYREHGMWEILDVLKRHHRGESQRRIAAATGRGRKTIRAYIREAKKLGWSKEVPPDEALASRVAQRRQPGPSSSEASASEKALRGHHDRIQQWVEGCEGERGLKLTKVHELLTREGVDVSYSSVYRYAAAHFGWARPKLTLRRAEVSPGELAEVDFGQLGKIYDPESDRNRLVWALLVTLGFSRHQYVHVSFSQKLDVVIDGLEEAWEFFGGVPLRVVVDNMKTAVVKSDRYEPIFQRTTEQYAEHRGFVIDPAVARHPTGKPIVERGVQYVRESFFRGEQWLDLAHVQREARRWCMEVAGRRIHGTTQKRPLVVFEQVELACLRPVKGPRFDTPQWATPTVHDDHHEVPQGPVLGSHALCGKASHGPRRQSARTHLLQKRAHQNPPQKTSRRKSDRLHRLSPRARGLRQARPGAYGAPSQETRQQHRPFHEPAPQRRLSMGQAPTGSEAHALGRQVRPCSRGNRLPASAGLRSHQCAKGGAHSQECHCAVGRTTTNRRARLNAPEIPSSQRKFLS